MAIAVVAGVMFVTMFVNASTTISTDVVTGGGVYASSTAEFDGLARFFAGASTTNLTLLNGETISNATDGTITFGASNTVLVGVASSSAIQVGDEPNASTINGMVMGYCSFSDVALAASSTAGFASCTTVPTGALVVGDRVFVQATSSFEAPYIITAASTTGVSTIQLRITNTGLGAADTTLTGTSVNFWAVRP